MATLYTNPIWKDTYYTTSSSEAEFYITLNGSVIFTGKAVRYPNAASLQININKICRNYLSSDIAGLLSSMPSSTTSIQNSEAQRTFQLYVGGSNVADYQFYNDYSYTDDRTGSGSIVVSNPINGHFVPGMLKVRTTRNSSSVTTQGSASSSTGLGYTTQVKCVPYVLYYLNSYGGWDAFAIEGTGKRKDTYTSYTTDQVFNNTTLEFETNKYVNEIKTSYELNTGLLSDYQGNNLAKNLLGSIKVYLQNIDEGWVKPVIISDSSVSYQSYQTNGRKMCQYKITVTESQTKIRK